jgi:hypothetical protein
MGACVTPMMHAASRLNDISSLMQGMSRVAPLLAVVVPCCQRALNTTAVQYTCRRSPYQSVRDQPITLHPVCPQARGEGSTLACMQRIHACACNDDAMAV